TPSRDAACFVFSSVSTPISVFEGVVWITAGCALRVPFGNAMSRDQPQQTWAWFVDFDPMLVRKPGRLKQPNQHRNRTAHSVGGLLRIDAITRHDTSCAPHGFAASHKRLHPGLYRIFECRRWFEPGVVEPSKGAASSNRDAIESYCLCFEVGRSHSQH